MKKHTIIAVSIFLIGFASCKENNIQKEKDTENRISKEKASFGEPNVNVGNLNNDFRTWWNYHSREIALESDFKAINESSKEITKLAFLEELVSGNFIPIKLKDNSNENYYKLYKLNEKTDKSIKRTIKSKSSLVLNHYKMEGKPFPDFNFVDLNGNEYNKKNTKGKIIVLKCWFINCQACVAEFPELNELVNEFKNDNSIQFISLAFEKKNELKKFIEKKPFSYKIIPEQREFMEKSLSVNQYPTHFIIDENGVILKIYSNADQMIRYLKGNYLIDQSKMSPPR